MKKELYLFRKETETIPQYKLTMLTRKGMRWTKQIKVISNKYREAVIKDVVEFMLLADEFRKDQNKSFKRPNVDGYKISLEV